MTDPKQLIKSEAMRLGFSHCGVACNDSLEELRPFYSGFLSRNGHAGMEYLETSFEKRMHPELLVEGTRSVIALLVNYYPHETIPEDDNFIFSKYAYGNDYHKVIKQRLKELINFMKQSFGPMEARGVCRFREHPGESMGSKVRCWLAGKKHADHQQICRFLLFYRHHPHQP